MSEIITDNIDRLQLFPLNRVLGWRVSFRSSNKTYHQLYSNGRLIDFTDTIDQRSFEIEADKFPQLLVVVAVAGEDRCSDLSPQLPENIRRPPWVYNKNIVRSTVHRPGDMLAVFYDHTSGTMETDASLFVNIFPSSVALWGFGISSFGQGGFAVDGADGPGFGDGDFGVGPFGINGILLSVNMGLCEEGTHDIEMRVVSQEGTASQPIEDNFEAFPPPAPVVSITPTSYDSETHKLTFTIEES